MAVDVPTASAAISTVLNAAPYNIRTIAYLSDTFSPPVALVAIHDTDRETFGNPGQWIYKFTVFVVVSRVDDRAGISALEGYMSPIGATSIRAALEADTTLGKAVDSCVMLHAGPPAALTMAASGVTYATCPFDVEVRTS